MLAKTLEPNFCHAKAYLFTCSDTDPRNNFFITGSSNLTDAGIGKKTTHNVELNIADFGSAPQYRELIEWFEELWNRPQAHTQKTLYSEDGKKFKKPFKQYLIDEIKKIFVEYTPRQLYYKVLFELFGNRLLEEEANPRTESTSRPTGKHRDLSNAVRVPAERSVESYQDAAKV